MGAEAFREQLTRLLAEQGMSLPQLAAAASYNRTYVWEIATGRKPPVPEFAAACDRALRSGATLSAVLSTVDVAHAGQVDRRRLLADLGAIGLAGPLAGAEAVRHRLGVALDDGGNMEDWDEIAADYARSFYETPPAVLLRDLTADLDVLGQQLAAAAGTAARGLSRVGGQLAAITAMAWASAGETRHAARWWCTARRAADQSGDLETRAWVWGWEVADGLYEQRPTARILAAADHATTHAGALVSAGTAGLYAGIAQTLAATGRREQALAALERVAIITGQLPADVVADEDSMFGWPEVRLRHTESYVYTWLGDSARAYAAQDQALALYPDALARERAAMLLHRATCMIRDGDVGGGLAYAGTVLDELPAEHHTDLVYAVARATVATVPDTDRHRREARELSSRLALPAGPTA